MLRTVYGPLWGRREQGLSRMLAFSLGLHLFFFIFIILSRSFWGLQPPSFQSFQVNLIDNGSGVAVSGAEKSRGNAAGSKKTGDIPPKKAAPEKTKAPEKKMAPPPQAKPKPGKAASNSSAPIEAPVRAPRSAVNPAPVEEDDPERLQEWWKKQKKALSTSKSTPAPKPKMGLSERTRTAKIDIQKRPVTPPINIPAKSAAKPAPAPEAGQKEPLKTDEEEGAGMNTGSEDSSDEKTGEESEAGSLGTAGGEPEMQTGALSGIKGVGASGGNASFNFPSYLQKVDQKVRWQWAPPPVTSGGDRLVVRFVVNKNGAIDLSSVKIEESSGNHFSDQAALRAVFAAHPLPPLPKAYHENLLTVYMNFVVREDS